AETWHSDPVDTWHSLLEEEPEEPAPPSPQPEPEPDRDSWRSILDQLLADVPPAPAKPTAEPIGFAHNGFHVDDEQRYRPVDHPPPLAEPRSSAADGYSTGRPARHESRPARHQAPDEQPEPRTFWFESNGKHSRDDDSDSDSRYGRHSMPWRD
ncbi:MAG TPA: MFS transporter, partial [Mycobacterium sp.]|nr:MFS transporter [Mycobacterium sp.]